MESLSLQLCEETKGPVQLSELDGAEGQTRLKI